MDGFEPLEVPEPPKEEEKKPEEKKEEAKKEGENFVTIWSSHHQNLNFLVFELCSLWSKR